MGWMEESGKGKQEGVKGRDKGGEGSKKLGEGLQSGEVQRKTLHTVS